MVFYMTNKIDYNRRPYRFHIDKIIKHKERREMDSKGAEERWEIFERAELESGEIKELSQEISSFFSRSGDFFDSDAKKAVFLEGVLAQILLDIEKRKKGETPFRAKNLNGLNLDEERIKKLFPKIQGALERYEERNCYGALKSVISKYFVLAGDGWGKSMSSGEISFYFVLGMNHSCLFKKLFNN